MLRTPGEFSMKLLIDVNVTSINSSFYIQGWWPWKQWSFEIANGFCDYFTNPDPSLAEKISTSNKPFSSFLKRDTLNSVFFPSTYQQEVLEICASLRSGSAAGFDNIHIDVVKQNIDVISKPLTPIINLSLSSGIVPKQLKIACIIKLFKSGDQDLYANYRPVSVLPIFPQNF